MKKVDVLLKFKICIITICLIEVVSTAAQARICPPPLFSIGGGPSVSTICGAAVSNPTGSYSTSFLSDENPISESGKWVSNPGANSWSTRVRTVGGAAFGDPASANVNDTVAFLAGSSWGPNQTVTTKVYRLGNPGSAEIEIHLRATWDTSHIYTYECDFVPTGLVIAKWLGAQGNYINLPFTNGTDGSYINGATGGRAGAMPPQDNETITATITGDSTKTTIKVYQGTTLIGQADDTAAISGTAPYANGAPGIGFDIGQGGVWSAWGFRDFSVTTAK